MKQEPLVMCLTNTVAANFTANCLLAVGAKPAMSEETADALELALAADAILVNLGTVTDYQADMMRQVAALALARHIPWVLDPVGIQALAYRKHLAIDLLASKPSIIRGNHAETEVILRSVPNVTMFSAILSTGETDLVYPVASDTRAEPLRVTGGVPILQSVTATGCAQGALCAAYLGWGQAPEKACISASRLMKTAGEQAYARAKTPGAFQVSLLDTLWELTHD